MQPFRQRLEAFRSTTGDTGDDEFGTHQPDGFTAVQISTLQARLDRQLGPEYISHRPGAGGSRVHVSVLTAKRPSTLKDGGLFSLQMRCLGSTDGVPQSEIA